jgi:hypothetical protein
MIQAARIRLVRHTGGERRRHSLPCVSSTSPIHPFGRSQTGRNSRLVIRHDQTAAQCLRLPRVHIPAPIVPNDRRRLFAVTA